MLILLVVCIPLYGGSLGGPLTPFFLSYPDRVKFFDRKLPLYPNFIFNSSFPLVFDWLLPLFSTLYSWSFLKTMPLGILLVDLALVNFWADLAADIFLWLEWWVLKAIFDPGLFSTDLLSLGLLVRSTFFCTLPFYHIKWATLPFSYVIFPSPCLISFWNPP